MSFLKIDSLTVEFSGIKALKGVSLEVKKGEIHGLIGPNGAGKTTLLNCISRFVQPSAGTITFNDVILTKLQSHQLAKLGVRRTFQDARILPELSVMENLLLGQHVEPLAAKFRSFIDPMYNRQNEARMIRSARETMELLRNAREQAEAEREGRKPVSFDAAGFPDLIDMENYPASMLPQGPRKMLDLARAIVFNPSLLLLDEPAAGAQLDDVSYLANAILDIRKKHNSTIFLVEHHMSLVMKVCDRITVLDFGEKIAEGTPEEIRTNQKVIDSYLGKLGSRDATENSRETITIESSPRKSISDKDLVSVENVELNYGSVKAISGVSLSIKEGSITAIIGANGAGKSTLLKSISGIHAIHSGRILYSGQVLSEAGKKVAPNEIVKKGVSQVLEGKQLFVDLSVRQNLIVGGCTKPKNIESNIEKVCGYFPVLKRKMDDAAGSLSGGEQQMLAIAQALMAEPKLLLLDEPSLGLAPAIIEKLFEIIKTINAKEGVTIGLVEQNAREAVMISDYGYVLEVGKVASHGPASTLINSESVQKSYLGM